MAVNTATVPRNYFFKGGFYFKVGEPDRIFDDRGALEFGLPRLVNAAMLTPFGRIPFGG
jgi:hypothetical protein